MKSYFAFTLLMSVSFMTSAQYAKKNTFNSVSSYEKKWALFHPFAAIKVKKLTQKAYVVLDSIKKNNVLDQYDNGGKLDAFRHCFTMALLAQKISVKKLRKLGKAHEKGNYKDFLLGKIENGESADSLSCEMDLMNNEVGFKAGTSNKKISRDSLIKLILIKINNGEARYMRRNEKGQYLDCNGNIIIMEEWKGKWNIPKCFH